MERQRTDNPEDDQDLFHCPDLQGVILGVGLAMLENLYHEHVHSIGLDGDSKRRKTNSNKNSPSPGDDDDDEHYPPVPVLKKKLKVGTGYAGDAREDVRTRFTVYWPLLNLRRVDFRPS